MRTLQSLILAAHLLSAVFANNNSETRSSGRLLSEEFEQDLEKRWTQLEQDVSRQKASWKQQVDELNRVVEKRVRKTKKHVKRRIEKDVLKQRQGWQRFRISVRDHIGFLLGALATFAGGGSVRLATGVQAAHLTWFSLHKFNATRGIHDPWLKDALSGIVAAYLVSQLPKASDKQVTVQKVLPQLTLSVAIARSVGIISHRFVDNVSPATTSFLQVAGAGIGIALLSMSPLPISLLATSVAGATLAFQSFIEDVVGNWFYMLQNLPERHRRSIRQFVYRELQKKLLYPVRNAFEQIQAAVRNKTLASPTLQQKVNEAIFNSYEVRIIWSFATMGVVMQMLLQKNTLFL